MVAEGTGCNRRCFVFIPNLERTNFCHKSYNNVLSQRLSGHGIKGKEEEEEAEITRKASGVVE